MLDALDKYIDRLNKKKIKPDTIRLSPAQYNTLRKKLGIEPGDSLNRYRGYEVRIFKP